MKRFKGVTLLAVLALLVAACGGSTGESAAPSGDEKPAGWLEALVRPRASSTSLSGQATQSAESTKASTGLIRSKRRPVARSTLPR